MVSRHPRCLVGLWPPCSADLPPCRSSPSCLLPFRADCVSSSSGCLSCLLLPGRFSFLWVPTTLIFLTTTSQTKPHPLPNLLLFLDLIPLGPFQPSSPLSQTWPYPCLLLHLISRKQSVPSHPGFASSASPRPIHTSPSPLLLTWSRLQSSQPLAGFSASGLALAFRSPLSSPSVLSLPLTLQEGSIFHGFWLPLLLQRSQLLV